jgi:UDP-N-acetyl-D-glucosamine dehydrogenase
MPHYVVSLVSDALNSVRLPLNGSRVLVAGVSYKRDVDDIRESPALDLLTLLQARGAELSYSDPHVPALSGRHWQNGVDMTHVDIGALGEDACDCIVVVTDHSLFNYDDVQRAAKVVVDTRNAIKAPGPHVVRLGAPRAVAEEPAVVA